MNESNSSASISTLLYIWSNFNIENSLIAQRSICAAVDDIKMVSNKTFDFVGGLLWHGKEKFFFVIL